MLPFGRAIRPNGAMPAVRRLLTRRLALPTLLLAVLLAFFARSAYRSYLRDGLFDAVDRGDTRAARSLLDRGADPNAIDKSPNTGFPGFPVLTRAITQERTEIVQALLEHGAKPSVKGTERYSPLQVAVMHGRADFVRLLLDHGANPNVAPYGKMSTPQPEIYRLLRDRGAKLTLEDAVRNDDVDTVLKLLGPNTDAIQGKTTDGWSPLCIAASTGSVNVVKALLDRGADVSHATSRNETPLLLAVHARSIPVLRILISRGADVNSRFDGQTLLVNARNHLGMLVQNRTPNTSFNGGTPPEEAIQQAKAVVKFLESHGAHD